MALNETIMKLGSMLTNLVRDLPKVNKGNKSAAQRVRVTTIDLEKVSKTFRKESIEAEKQDRQKTQCALSKPKKKVKLKK